MESVPLNQSVLLTPDHGVLRTEFNWLGAPLNSNHSIFGFFHGGAPLSGALTIPFQSA